MEIEIDGRIDIPAEFDDIAERYFMHYIFYQTYRKHFYKPKDWEKSFDEEMDDECVEELCPHFDHRNDYAKVIHAHWDFCVYVKYDGHSEGIHHPMVRCSNCKHCFRAKLLWVRNYCPNCGAKMDEVTDGTGR